MLEKSKIQILLILSFSIVLFLVGCVDTSVNPIPDSFNFRSQVKVVNLAGQSATIDLINKSGDKTSFGTVAFGAESQGGFKDIPAGSKTLMFNSESYKVTTETDRKIRLFVMGATSSERHVVKLTERYIFQTKNSPNNEDLYPKDSAVVAFINGSFDASIDGLHATANGIDTTITFASSVAPGKGMGGIQLKAADYTIGLMIGDSTYTSFPAKLGSQNRYTAVAYDSTNNLKGNIFLDD